MHKRFVEQREWINEQTVCHMTCSLSLLPDPLTSTPSQYHELFAIANSLPGPASTQLLFNINTIRAGFFGGLLAFMFWA